MGAAAAHTPHKMTMTHVADLEALRHQFLDKAKRLHAEHADQRDPSSPHHVRGPATPEKGSAAAVVAPTPGKAGGSAATNGKHTAGDEPSGYSLQAEYAVVVIQSRWRQSRRARLAAALRRAPAAARLAA